MLLVLTHSEDITTDMVLDRLPDLETFRFNIDLWRDYSWQMDGDGFLIRDPSGRLCTDGEVRTVYLRKLFFNPPFVSIPAGGSEESWTRGELERFWLGIRDIAHEDGRLALVHPAPTGRWNKMRQMRVAAEYFRVPSWSVFHRDCDPVDGGTVVKSLGSGHTGGGGVLMVRKVDATRLSPDYPWFTQRHVEATHDVTVAYVDGRLFAYQLPRDLFQGDDCRFPSAEGDPPWEPCSISNSDRKAILAFMERTGYSFGRMDFLRDKDGLWFLELNPNGQFAWLDPHGQNGLLDAVADAIRSVHHRPPTPVRPSLPAF